MSQKSRIIPAEIVRDYCLALELWQMGLINAPPDCQRIGLQWGVSKTTIARILKERGVNVKQRMWKKKSGKDLKRKLASDIDKRKKAV